MHQAPPVAQGATNRWMAIGAGSLDVVGSIVRNHSDWRYTTFAARCETAEPVPNDESLALDWASLDDLLHSRLDRPVHPAFAEDLPRLAEVIRGSICTEDTKEYL